VSDVVCQRVDRVVVITLARPERGNAVGGTLFADLLTHLERADSDETIGAVVTTGAGRTFCVGADADELESLLDQGPIDLDELGIDGIGGYKGLGSMSRTQTKSDRRGIGRWVRRVVDLDIPTVAAINGPAAGGGLALALLHDVRIASTQARLFAAMPHLGLAPEMGMSWLLPRLVGASRAFDVMTRAGPIEADEALALGLLNEVVEPGELVDAALSRAQELASLPPHGVRAMKHLLRETWSATLDDQLEREWAAQRLLFADADTAAALRRMIARRKRRRGDAGRAPTP
jgi:2-(1,2-epoxy-1,2-dihydrophenyl)acetyl-CoA isomerase